MTPPIDTVENAFKRLKMKRRPLKWLEERNLIVGEKQNRKGKPSKLVDVATLNAALALACSDDNLAKLWRLECSRLKISHEGHCLRLLAESCRPDYELFRAAMVFATTAKYEFLQHFAHAVEGDPLPVLKDTVANFVLHKVLERKFLQDTINAAELLKEATLHQVIDAITEELKCWPDAARYVNESEFYNVGGITKILEWKEANPNHSFYSRVMLLHRPKKSSKCYRFDRHLPRALTTGEVDCWSIVVLWPTYLDELDAMIPKGIAIKFPVDLFGDLNITVTGRSGHAALFPISLVSVDVEVLKWLLSSMAALHSDFRKDAEFELGKDEIKLFVDYAKKCGMPEAYAGSFKRLLKAWHKRSWMHDNGKPLSAEEAKRIIRKSKQ